MRSNQILAAGTASLILAGAAIAINPASATTESAGGMSCAISVQRSGGMLALTGVIAAEKKISGEYRFKVSGGGSGNSSNISQGGPFTAAPGASAILGEVTLSPGSYDAELTVTANGTTLRCADRIGATI